MLLNNEETDAGEIPNANVNMEYGLMLAFNKYILPFQRASQRLPFNVAGLNYMYLGNFSMLRREVIVWRVNILTEILDGRRAALDARVKAGITTATQAQLLNDVLSRLQIWIAVTTDAINPYAVG